MAHTSGQRGGGRLLAVLAIGAVAFTGAVTAAAAQEATPVVAETATMPYPATIHAGTCADYVARPAHILDEARPRAGATVGAAAAAPVVSATSTLELALDDLLATGHAIVVHESPDAFGAPLACGDLGGVIEEGTLVTALRPIADSGLAGLAILSEDAGLLQLGDERVDIALHLFSLADPEPPAVATPQPVAATGEGFAHPEWLVEPAWLDQRLDQQLLWIIGLQRMDVIEQGSVPGASQMPSDFLLPPDTSAETLQLWRDDIVLQVGSTQMGSVQGPWTATDTLVLYDSGTHDSAALWWALDYLGHEDKRIIDGGWRAWADYWDVPAAAMPAAPLGPVRAATDQLPHYQPQFREERLATLDDVVASLANEDVVLLDTRPAEEYAVGHIPGAVNVPVADNLAADGQRWRAADELRERYTGVGIAPGVAVIAYGDSGTGAAVAYVTLRLLGHEMVSLYPAGWDEWSRYPDLPRSVAELAEDAP